MMVLGSEGEEEGGELVSVVEEVELAGFDCFRREEEERRFLDEEEGFLLPDPSITNPCRIV